MTVTAAQAIANYKNNPHGPPQAVGDSAANVGGLLDGLLVLTAAGALQSIVFTDPSAPTLSLTAPQLVNDAGFICPVRAPRSWRAPAADAVTWRN